MPTEEQNREELKTNALNYSIIAGAGAGKTTLLADRISNQLMEGEPLEGFAIITYTNVAAHELREKIVKVLKKQLKSEGISQTKRDNANKALENIELMQISTIHSFLFKILKEHCFDSGLSLDTKMLEAAEEEVNQRNFFTEWRNNHIKEIDLMQADWDRVECKKSEDKQHEMVKYEYKKVELEKVLENLFMEIASVREEIYIDKAIDDGTFYKDLLSRAKKFVEGAYGPLIKFGVDVKANVPKTKSGANKGKDFWQATAKHVKDAIDSIQNSMSGKTIEGLNDDDTLALAVSVAIIFQHTEDGKDVFYGKTYSENNVSIMSKIPPIWDDEAAKLIDDYYMWKDLYRATKAVNYAKKIRDAYQKMCDSEVKYICNEDLLFRAKRLLENNPDILDELRERYTKIYLDEAQDTTNIQLDIIKLLAGKPKTDLSSLQLKENCLIIVGDPKQSIYRFSGAEKLVYDNVNKLIDSMNPSLAKQVKLDANYRSNEDIVAWVNDRYSKLMSPSEYDFMETNWKVDDKESLHGVYYYPENRNTGMNDCDKTAELISNLIYNPDYTIEEFKRDEESGEYKYKTRMIKPSDFIIITQYPYNIDKYTKALRRYDVGVSTYGKFKVTEERILNDFISLVKCVDNGKYGRYHVVASQIVEGVDATDMKYSFIEELWNNVATMRREFKIKKLKPAAIVNYLLHSTELYFEKNKAYSKEELDYCRTRLYQMVECCLAGNIESLGIIVERMEKYLEAEIGRELALIPDEDTVRIMNVHKVKGLTGKIIIIADRTGAKMREPSGFRSQGIYYPYLYLKNQYKSITYECVAYKRDKDLYDAAKQAEDDEKIRLEYVAATRAAHTLIIMPSTYSKYKPLPAWFSNFEGAEDILEWMSSHKSGTPKADIKEAAAKSSSVHITQVKLDSNIAKYHKKKSDEKTKLDELKHATLASITPSSFEGKGSSGYGVGDEHYKREDRPRGNIFGNVTHRSFELVINSYDRLKGLDDSNLEKSIEKIIKRAILDNKKDFGKRDDETAFMEFLKPVAIKYFKSYITDIMEEAEEAYPELSFGFYVPQDDVEKFTSAFSEYMEKAKIEIHGDRVWVNGQMDLVVKTKSGRIKIYDYKSDGKYGKPDEEYLAAMKAKYKGQFELYRSAASRIFDVPLENVDEVKIIHFYMEGLD